MSTDRRAVVLGGAGFIGRRVCRDLTRAGWDVVAVSRRPVPLPGVRTQPLDLCTASVLPLLLHERPAVVVNAAGGVFGATEREMRDANVLLVEQLVTALTALSWTPRLIQLGTVHEHGDAAAGAPLTEDTPTRPTSVYGQTKLRATTLVRSAHAAGAIDAVVLRVVNLLGRDAPTTSLPGRVVAELARLHRRGESGVLELLALNAARDYIDVADVADAVVRAAVRPVGGRVIPIGSGAATSVRWLVHELVAISGVPATVAELEPVGPGAVGNSGGAHHITVDTTLADQLLGWRARTTLTGSLRAMWLAASEPAPELGAVPTP
ncbi:NAD(P)-dependent oxidoreductase [Micromonospora sp. NPDC050200]|uniref:NAD-dependent epimerase/dehydratase family protein n=1 Tax=Micromonospora sp. NPDC050200 TaxID=3155664 RepID=UPI003407A524